MQPAVQKGYAPHPPRMDTRFIGDLMGSYVLASRAQGQGAVQVFACRARSISAFEAVISAPVAGAPGEALSVTFQQLGILRGRVVRVVESGFVASFDCTDAERALLASRIDWLKRRALKTVSDRRSYKRVLPRETRSRLLLGDGTSYDCFIMDMSQSGVAVSADVLPPLGSLASVGSVRGRVARYVDAGFALQFAELQQLDKLEALLTLKASNSGQVLAAEQGAVSDAEPRRA